MTPSFHIRSNYFYVVLRCLGVLISLGFILLDFYMFKSKSEFRSLQDTDYYLLVLKSTCYLYAGGKFNFALFTKSKHYTLLENAIKQYNFLTFSTKYYERADVTGFSTYDGGTYAVVYKVITIYLVNGKHIELQEHDYDNFFSIQKELIARGYSYLGEEQHHTNLLGVRRYKF